MSVWDRMRSLCKSNTAAAMGLRPACSRVIIKDKHTAYIYLTLLAHTPAYSLFQKFSHSLDIYAIPIPYTTAATKYHTQEPSCGDYCLNSFSRLERARRSNYNVAVIVGNHHNEEPLLDKDICVVCFSDTTPTSPKGARPALECFSFLLPFLCVSLVFFLFGGLGRKEIRAPYYDRYPGLGQDMGGL